MSKNDIKNMLMAWLESKYEIKNLKYIDSCTQYNCNLSRYEVKINDKYYIAVTNYEKETDELLFTIQDRKGKLIDYWINTNFKANLEFINSTPWVMKQLFIELMNKGSNK